MIPVVAPPATARDGRHLGHRQSVVVAGPTLFDPGRGGLPGDSQGFAADLTTRAKPLESKLGIVVFEVVERLANLG